MNMKKPKDISVTSRKDNEFDFVVGDLVKFVGYNTGYVEIDHHSEKHARVGIILDINKYYDVLYRVYWLKDGLQTDVIASNIRLLYVEK